MVLDLTPALDLIGEFEGLRLKAYKDPVGIWTIGFGTTDGVTPGMTITKRKAEELLLDDILTQRIPAIRGRVKVPLSNNEICALVSFTYNVGNGAFAKSTLLRRLNAKEPRSAVADEFLKWNKARGWVLAGLTRRRKAERLLFLTPDPVQQSLA